MNSISINEVKKAGNWVRVDETAVALQKLSPNTHYQISGTLFHDQIQMGMVAIPANFPNDPHYIHAVFSTENQVYDFNSTMSVNGEDVTFSQLYFYTLLAIGPGESRMSTSPDFRFGVDDGKSGELPASTGAVLLLQFTKEKGSGQTIAPPPHLKDFPILPGGVIEYVEGFTHQIRPVDNNDWVDFRLISWKNKPTIETNAMIHLVSGDSGEDLLAVIENGDNLNQGWFNFNDLSSNQRNVNMFGLIHPVLIDGEYIFQLGDPEKDGKVKLVAI